MQTTQFHLSPHLGQCGSLRNLERRSSLDLPRIGNLAVAAMLLFAAGCGARPLTTNTIPSSTDQASGSQSSGSTATAPQTLPPQSLSPTTTMATTGQTVAFTAPFGGVPLTWMVNGVAGGNSTTGWIDAVGNYTAPLLPTSAPVTVSAQLVVAQGSSPLVAQGSVQIVNPAPQLAQTVPSAISLGSPQMTIVGTGFNPESTVMLNGQRVTTTFVDTSHLSTQLPHGANASSVTVAVTNAAPGGGTTSTITLPILSTGTPAATSHPLVARLSANLPTGASIFAEFGPDTTYGRKTWTQSAPAASQPTTLLVAGMRASSTYHMRLHFILADATELLGEDETFTTGDVPAVRVPPITVTQNPTMTPSPGIEMLDFVTGFPNEFYAAAVDLDGNLIWYYDFPFPGGPQGIKQLLNGNIGLVLNPNSYQEIDLTGTIVRQVTLDQLNQQLVSLGSNIVLTQIHHDFVQLPNGNVVLITMTVKDIDNLSGFPGVTAVAGDVLVELDPSLRNILWTWSEFDHLDVNRHPWFPLLSNSPQVYDWTHTNALLYSARDNDLIVSIRQQSWIVKIDFQDGNGTGDILWHLGPQGDFALVGGIDPVDWFYNEHFPSLATNESPAFNFDVFDNGNTRPVDVNGTWCGVGIKCYSRPVSMTIDENARTATLNWAPHIDFSNFGGVSETLAPNRIEYTLADDAVTNGGRVVESTMDLVPIEVLRFDTKQLCYRATRIPSLYPGVTWDPSSK